ncbi:GTP-binding protein [Buchnera aphidicola (Nipponaphis monzeni)]|uniref:50S ribosomal subunit assembly factor BipA n=1 Tax=Buchnera aphidicola (Nipponaphis monzeni) TaxID=2495405 RepID=A0A455TAK5_9GAMM|nr:translational GTPase TypA [Buchnera aphidicola]BBI01330.1 GTP-binding protein [Buchnera aphidicola (Nipponaphis monzeni)]
MKFKNIAVIAHVDHGKTTLIDKLLQQSGVFKKHEDNPERIMDSNDLEKERGITITSKHASIFWKNYKINIVDTPGHADFGGEVERILSMVDSVLLIVDAFEGPMPQTVFVTKKSFNYNLKPIVIINKIDRANVRPNWVIDQIFDLFVNLNANDEQLDFPIIYTSALKGTAGLHYSKMEKNMNILFKTIVEHIPNSYNNINKDFQMQISQLDYDKYLGLIGIGKIQKGCLRNNQQVTLINSKNKTYHCKINKIFHYVGLKLQEIKLAKSGDIIAITGIDNLQISDTICELNTLQILPKLKIDKPTVKILFSVNSSPFCGQEGNYITSRHILERLKKEAISNVALKFEETNDANQFCVAGRGELHLSILIENMRREGFELELSRPNVIFKIINNCKQEPFENVMLDIETKHQGAIMKLIGEKKGELKNVVPNYSNNNRIRIDYILSSRALIGFRNEFMNITSGTGIFHSSFHKYYTAQNYCIGQRRNGVLIANKSGYAVGFSLFNLQNRGKLFICHGTKVYEGQIIGIHNRSNDLTVNCLTGKKLSNMRASGSDEAITLIPPTKITLEQALGFINDDELIEVTPNKLRLRKKFLKENERKKNSKIEQKF